MSKDIIVSDIEYRSDGTLWWTKSGSGRNLNKPIGTLTHQGYLQCTFQQTQKKVHHLVWFLHHGYWPTNLDHINKDKSDNRIENLREGASVNNHNRNMPLPVSGLQGAQKSRGKYRASIRINGETEHLGVFSTPEEASKVYLKRKGKLLNV